MNDGKLRPHRCAPASAGLDGGGALRPDAAWAAGHGQAPPPPVDEEVDAAIEDLTRSSGRRLAAYAVKRPEYVEVVGEISVAEFAAPRWAAGADVDVRLTRGAGELVASATGRIAPGERSVRMLVAFKEDAPAAPDAAPQPLHASMKASVAGATIEGGAEVAFGGRLLGQPTVYRARTANTAPIYPVAELQFARTERLRVDVPVVKPAAERHARLLRRTGETMSGLPEIVERQVDGRTILSIDLSLSFLAPADYVFELFVKDGDVSDRKLVAFVVK